MARFARALGRNAERYEGLADRARTGFARFWNPGKKFCFDVIDAPGSPEGKDATLRPNQILAVSLPISALAPEQQRGVVEVCARELLISFGLRSLGATPNQGRYAGSPRRDATEPITRARRGAGFSVHSRWLTCACTGTPARRCLFWSLCSVTSRQPGSARPAKFLTVTRRSRRTDALRKHGQSGKPCGRGEPSRRCAIRKRPRAALFCGLGIADDRSLTVAPASRGVFSGSAWRKKRRRDAGATTRVLTLAEFVIFQFSVIKAPAENRAGI